MSGSAHSLMSAELKKLAHLFVSIVHIVKRHVYDCLVLKRQNFKCLRPLTFTGFVVRLQPVSSRAGAVVANLQIVAVVRAAAISGQTLIVVCRDKQAKSFQIIFTTTKSLADREFTHSNHKLCRSSQVF